MLGMNYRLKDLQEKNTPINVGIIGAGQMGRGLISQLYKMKGMTPSVVCDIDINKVLYAFSKSNINENDYIITNKLSQANDAIKKGKIVVSEDKKIASQVEATDCVVDATGFTDIGAEIAIDTINNGKNIVMLDVEADVVMGPILKKKADQAGVIYTGSAGDEPGAVKEMFDFCEALAFDIKVIGKGKNNDVDYSCTPDSIRDYAISRGVSPKMQCSFSDGTKNMVELCCMANSTGLVPDVRGGHGPKSDIKQLSQILSLKEEGGILNSYGVVEWVNGIAPGVFVIVSSDLEFIHHEMQYLRIGEGPNYVLYRPYHLCGMETPLTIARAVLDKAATIVPMDGLVCEAMTIAKKDLKKGEKIDGIGGFCTYGTIDKRQTAKELNALPIGLITGNTIMKNDVKKGEIITYDDVLLEEDSLLVKLRREQDKIWE
ncbi:SAF domain-containing protein [Anaerofustis sp.]|uniref:NAD(P)H-dependent oxidoreductase n=1 Tax=Anaerofustis sp. TaxID=1872517 RepID=UPI0025C008AD|nr:SAF domain-containing protein [Anaerofustis sp.]